MSIVHGRGGSVWLAPGAGPAGLIKLGTARTWEFDVDEQFGAGGAFVQGWMTWLPLYLSWTGIITGNLDCDDSTIFTAMNSGTGPTATRVKSYIALYPDPVGHPSKVFNAYCWPRVRVKSDLHDVTRYTLTMQGEGQLQTI